MARYGKLSPGDRVAYTAAFLRQLGADRGFADRRGTYLGPSTMGSGTSHVRVRWDDEDLSAYAADPEYQDHVRKNGSTIALSAIAKVGSARFGDPHA